MAVKMPGNKPMVGKPIIEVPDFSTHLGGKAQGTITKEHKTGKEEFKTVSDVQQDLSPPQLHPESQLMHIEVLGSRTVNLGNFESARVSVAVRMPCTKADLEESYTWASDWVSEKIKEATKGEK